LVIHADEAYEQLRAFVRFGEFEPGQLLSESMLIKRLGLGRTPVREAILRLVHEGLLVRGSERGLSVNLLGPEAVRELYEARETLEVFCARRAAERPAPVWESSLGVALEEGAEAAGRGVSWAEYRDHDQCFHTALAEAGNNRRVASMLASMFDAAILDPWFIRIGAIEGQMDRSVTEHRAIVEAIADHDPDLAEKAVREHAVSYRRALAEHLFNGC
jgi:DNA-binding GntR family transcriptional regulator